MASLEVADVFRQFAPSYLAAYGAKMLPSHLHAIEDILACHTEQMGGHMYYCEGCNTHFYVFHGCGNRACPSCHYARTVQWLESRRVQMLPCPYFHLVFTLPEHLRLMVRNNQCDSYNILMTAAARTVLKVCADRKYLGGTPAIMAVLHTWTVKMGYHPHVHLLVSGGGMDPNDSQWRMPRDGFLAPVRVLSRLFEGIFMDLLRKERPDLKERMPKPQKRDKWVVWADAIAFGPEKVLDYLGRYIHRIAIANCRIIAMDEQHVVIRYKDRKANKWRTLRLDGHEFMRRFLQHVLPAGFHKVRYYGLWHSSKTTQIERIRFALELKQGGGLTPHALAMQAPADVSNTIDLGTGEITGPPCPHCPRCGNHNTRHIRHLQPQPKPSRVQDNARASPTAVA